jgi:tetratricopeptide (TPR) repeat protein
MKKRAIGFAAALCLLVVPRVCAQEEEHHHHEDGEQLGSVSFPTSCSPDVQQSFERAVALMHSFQYQQAQEGFDDVARKDKHCAMARWGQAMVIWHQLWDQPDAPKIKQGHHYIHEAQKLGAKTDREQKFIAAAALFYAKGKKLDYRTRAQNYSDAMGRLYAQYPDDTEAAAFYALSLLSFTPLDNKDFANRRKAIPILDKLFAEHPDHPGAAHYLIHAADRPQLASLGLNAARRYAQIAPSSSHALHMPSHIFSRLGLWQDSINSNLAAAAAADKSTRAGTGDASYEFHAMDYLQYAYLQSGREKDAWHVIEELDSVPGAFAERKTEKRTYFTGRYYFELHLWSDAAKLPVPASGSRDAKASAYQTRAIGAARSGDAVEARKNLAKLNEPVAGGGYSDDDDALDWVDRQEVIAWVAYAEGKKDDALKFLREAADREDRRAPETGDMPAREMLADMLLEMNRAADALVEYQTLLQESPNRFDGLYGAARAAELAGKGEQAASYYSQLLKVCDGGVNSSRPELARAKTLALNSGGH